MNKQILRDLSDLGFDLKEARENKQIARTDAAIYCGVSYNMYSQWERGITKKVSKERFEKLKELLA